MDCGTRRSDSGDPALSATKKEKTKPCDPRITRSARLIKEPQTIQAESRVGPQMAQMQGGGPKAYPKDDTSRADNPDKSGQMGYLRPNPSGRSAFRPHTASLRLAVLFSNTCFVEAPCLGPKFSASRPRLVLFEALRRPPLALRPQAKILDKNRRLSDAPLAHPLGKHP